VVEAYQQAISHDKNNVNAQIALAVLYKRMGRIDDMSKTMDALRVVAPDNLQLGLLSADYGAHQG